MSISAGVVRAVALQQIDHAPHAKASAEGNHKGLQSGDGRSEKLHIFLRFSGVKAPTMKKAALAGGSLLTGFYTRFLFAGGALGNIKRTPFSLLGNLNCGIMDKKQLVR